MKHALHAMIDIETLSTSPNAHILQVAWVFFNKDSVIEETSFDINFQNCKDLKLDIDGDTLAWWFEQEDSTLLKRVNQEHAISIRQLNKSLSGAIHDHAPRFIWAKHPELDIAVLKNAFHKAQLPIPWKYRQIKDLSTLLTWFDEVARVSIKEHDALSDALAQAKTLQRILKEHATSSTVQA